MARSTRRRYGCLDGGVVPVSRTTHVELRLLAPATPGSRPVSSATDSGSETRSTRAGDDSPGTTWARRARRLVVLEAHRANGLVEYEGRLAAAGRPHGQRLVPREQELVHAHRACVRPGRNSASSFIDRWQNGIPVAVRKRIAAQPRSRSSR